MINARWDVLAEAHGDAARAFVTEQAAVRHHLVVYLSGSHAYGFPSPDSDLDLKCVHIAPTRALVGLNPEEGGAERMELRDGVEIDYGSNELGGVLLGVLKGNGNYIERLLGELVLAADDARLTEVRPLVRAALSRRVQRHYLGFATSQRRSLAERPTAKRVLYVLRTALTGLHLVRTGELVTDLRPLAIEHGLGEVSWLIEVKQRGEKTALDATELARWDATFDGVLGELGAAASTSVLPEEPAVSASANLDAWLREVRRALW